LDKLEVIFFVGFFYLLTIPKEKIMNFKTPLAYIMDIISERKKKHAEMELVRVFIQTKNIIFSLDENKINSDFILERIRHFTVLLRPVFDMMIGLWDLGERDEACNYLILKIKTQHGKMYADLLRKIDTIKKEDLILEINMYLETIRKERKTILMKKSENRSFIVYALISISISIVLINFVIVVGFIDTMNILKNII
jgi:hypothetical protein